MGSKEVRDKSRKVLVHSLTTLTEGQGVRRRVLSGQGSTDKTSFKRRILTFSTMTLFS